jgi:hypothetical protein
MSLLGLWSGIMTKTEREAIIANSWHSHKIVEKTYLNDPAVAGDENWLEKQRILLADMALHLLQTAVNPGEMDNEKLKNNLFSILTIADQFLPDADLAEAKKKIF